MASLHILDIVSAEVPAMRINRVSVLGVCLHIRVIQFLLLSSGIGRPMVSR